MNQGISTILEKLNSNPLFQISLGSKELFHSNFIAWCIERDPDLGNDLFSSIGGVANNLTPCSKFVDRERGNTDLWLNYEEGNVIIENKVKSVPYRAQLDKYAGKNVGKANYFYVLSLQKPTFFTNDNYISETSKEPVKWHYLSYKDIADVLSRRQQNFKEHNEYIQDYIEFARSLDELSKYLTVGLYDQYDFSTGLLPEEVGRINLRNYRLHDLYVKHKFSSLELLLKEKVFPIFNDNRIEVGYDFTNGTGLISARRIYPTKHGDVHIGVQLQNTAFRLFSMWYNQPERSVKLRDSLKDSSLWFDFNSTGIIHAESDIKGVGKDKSGYNNYSGHFFYKYLRLKDLSVSELLGHFQQALRTLKNRESEVENLINSIP
jgi:hypothetical protein